MGKKNIPGLYGLVENEILAVSLFSTSIICFINALIYLISANDYHTNNSLFKMEPFLMASQLSTLLVFLFYYMDNNYDSKIWNGNKRLLVTESEEPKYDAFIIRKMNAHSSVFQFFIGAYSLFEINDGSNLTYASTLFGLCQMYMGIVSYIWWSSNLYLAHLIDNFLMDSIVNATTVLVLSVAFPEIELLFLILNLAYTYYKSLDYQGAQLVKYSIILLCSSLLPVIRHGTCGDKYLFFTGTLFTLGGLVPKIADYTHGFTYGTSFFHFMEAIGFLMFYKWVHSFPII